MFKRFIIWLLIFAVFAANFSTALVYVEFKINQTYISNHLCINRNKPWMHCNGHCYFMLKIKQAEEHDRKQNAKDTLAKMEVSFCQEPFRIAFIEPISLASKKSIFLHNGFQYGSSFIENIFKPPRQFA
eukprot:gene14796-14928_t